MIRTHRLGLALACLFALDLHAQAPTYLATTESQTDVALSTLPGNFLLSVPGVFEDFVIAGGGQFVQLPDGSARLTGRVFSLASIYSAFLFDVHLTGRVQPGDVGYPPATAPDLQLLPDAYVPTGPIDPAAFTYYTAATGTLTGVRNLDGAVLTLQSTGPIQVGVGANNRNGEPGLQANFTVTVVQQPFGGITPTGTASIVCDLPADLPLDTTHPQPDSLRTTLTTGRAMVLPGVADDYVFVPAADWTEFDDGTASLTGSLARFGQLDDAWDVTLSLQNRIDPGEVGCPPVGSPVLQMLPSAYVANGGTMDPEPWHYYQNVTGSLVGKGLNAGGELSLTNSVALQVGGGANQTNTYFGFYGAFTVAVVTPPSGRTLSITGDAELFGLTAIFPVLPFPTLVVPATTPSLPTLTDQGMVLEGTNLAWAELIAIGFDLVGGHDASQWYGGWFRVIDNEHIEVHPRPGAVPGSYAVAVYNPALPSNSITVDLVAPSAPALYSEAEVPAWYTQHLLAHSGPVIGPAATLITLSTSLLPSVAPGLVTLDIGNGFSELVIDWNIYINDPATGIAAANYLNVPTDFLGQIYHLQSVTLDFGDPTWLWASSNVWSVQY